MPFVKSEPSWEVWFHDPSQQGLDFVPFDQLSPEEKARFISYCRVRYGTEEVQECCESGAGGG